MYYLGAHRQQWIPFWPPFLTTDKRFIKNTSSHRIKLIKEIIYWIIKNQAQALLPSPFLRGSLHRIGQIYTSHAVGAANGSPLWWCLLLSCAGGRWYFSYYSYRRKATEQEFFVPAQTLIGVILLRGWFFLTIRLTGVTFWPTHACTITNGTFINSKQKKRASKWPILERLHIWMVQFNAETLSWCWEGQDEDRL